MTLSLAPHIHIAFLDDRVVLLDTLADRYRMLGPMAADALRALVQGQGMVREETVEALVRAQVLTEGTVAVATVEMPAAEQSAQEWPAIEPPPIPVLAVAAETLRVAARLRWQGLHASLEAARRADLASVSMDRRGPVGFAQAFHRSRSRLPFGWICLRDSLVLHAMLARAGFPASLVIGVRLDPFAAHCWVQSEAVLLSDRCDTVAGFTPILVL